MSDAVSDRSDRRRELLRARLRAEGFKQELADQAANTQVGDSGTVTDQRILGRLIANAGAAGMLTWAFPIPEDAATQARIRDAIIAVAQHRPDLRTTVSADDTGGLQRTVLTADTVVTPSSDSAEPTEVDALAATPIDPTSEPPLRARFLHTPDGTMLVVSTHHVAADEHTWVLLLRDINAEIASPGVLSAQPTPPRSDATTAQVATATERRLTAVRPATHDVDGEPTPQPDPFAAERTTTANNTADRITLPAPQDWVQAVQGRAKADNTTVLSVLIDAAAHVIARRAGAAHDATVVVGTPTDVRDALGADAAESDGDRVSVVPCPIPVGSSLSDVAAAVRAASADRCAGLDDVIRAAGLPHIPGRSPLVDVVVTHRAGTRDLVIDGEPSVGVFVHSGAAPFDAVLSLEESEQDAQLTLEFRHAALRPTTAQRVLEEWRDAAIHPAQGTEVPDLPEVATTAQDVVRAVASHAAATPDAVAVEDGTTTLTYAQLNASAATLAKHITAQGAQPGDVVALRLSRGVGIPVALLAALRAGTPFVAIDPNHPAERSRMILDAANPALIIDDSDVATALTNPVDAPQAPDWSQAHPAYLVFTSGTTGTPKGIVIPRSGLDAVLGSMQDTLQLTADDTYLAASTLGFDISIVENLLPLLAGATVHVAPADFSIDIDAACALLHRVRPTVMEATPSLWAEIVHQDPQAVRGIRACAGGEALPHTLVTTLRAAGADVFNLYGPSEAAIVATSHHVTGNGTPPLGTTLPSVGGDVLGAALTATPDGALGELYLSGPHLGYGYLGDPALTALTFVAAPGGQRRYRTGDLVARDVDTRDLMYLGRADEQLSLHGLRIERGEIEAALAAAPGVTAAAVRVDTAAETPTIVGYVVLADAQDDSVAAIQAAVANALPSAARPNAIVVVDEFPRTPTGKIDRARLPLPEDTGNHQHRAADNPEEHAVVQAVQDVLELDSTPSIDADFRALGGHSLLAHRLALTLSTALGVHVPVRAVIEEPTLAALAEACANLRDSNATDATEQPEPSQDAEPEDGPIEALAGQRRVILAEQLDGENGLYTIPLFATVTGTIDTDRLSAALTSVVAAHPVLRSRLSIDDVGIINATLLSPEEALAQPIAVHQRTTTPGSLATFLDELVRTPFPATSDQPLQAYVVQVAEQGNNKDTASTVLALLFHHAFFDEWSLQPFFTDLARAYDNADALNTHNGPSFHRIHAIASTTNPADVDFWSLRQRDTAPGAPAPLPFSRAAAVSAGAAGTALGGRGPAIHRTVTIPAIAAASPDPTLKATAGDVVKAAVLLFLKRAGADPAVGIPVSGRHHPELLDVVGYLGNTLPVTVDHAGDAAVSFSHDLDTRKLIEAVHHEVLDVAEHSSIPIEELSGTAPFQVIVDHRVGAPQVPVTADWSSELLPVVPPLPKFPVTIVHTELPNAAGAITHRIDVLFSGDYFEQRGADAFVEALQHTIMGVAQAHATPQGQSDVSTTLGAIALSPETHSTETRSTEPETAGGRGVDTQADTQPDLRDMTIPELIDRQLTEHQDEPMLSTVGVTLTGAEVQQHMRGLAARISAAYDGVTAGRMVAIHQSTRFDEVLTILGVMASGAAFTVLRPDDPADRLAAILADANVSLIISSDPDKLPAGHPPVLPDSQDTLDISQELAAPTPQRNPNYPAYMVFTSGTTGRPKGVLVDQRAMSGLTGLIFDLLSATSSTDPNNAAFRPRLVSIAPMSFDVGLLEVIATFCTGGHLYVAHDMERVGPPLAEAVRRHRATHFASTPTVLGFLGDPSSISEDVQIFSGAEPLPADLAERWCARHRLINLYGPTEVTVNAIHGFITPDPTSSAIPIGVADPHVTAVVLDSALQPTPIGMVGELWLAGDKLAVGYPAMPGTTASVFVAAPDHLGLPPGSRMYRTGDLAVLRPDGQFLCLGRVDDQMKIRGLRIEPAEIETALRADSRVDGARVVHVPGSRIGSDRDILAAAVVPTEGTLSAASLADIRHQLASQLPRHLVPQRIVQVPGLPVTPNGKADRATTLLMVLDALSKAPDEVETPSTEQAPHTEPAAEPAAPVSPQFQALAEEVAILLDTDPRSIREDDDFLELGGDSILALQLIAKLKDRGWVTAARDIFDARTLGDLARALTPADGTSGTDDAEAESVAPIEPPSDLGTFAPIRVAAEHLADAPDSVFAQSMLLTMLEPVSGHGSALVDALVARHPAFRTRVTDTGECETLAEGQSYFDTETTTLTGDTATEDLAQLRHRLAENLDVRAGVLLAGAEVSTDSGPMLLLVAHHMAVDAASWMQIIGDMRQMVIATMSGRELPEPEGTSPRAGSLMVRGADAPPQPELRARIAAGEVSPDDVAATAAVDTFTVAGAVADELIERHGHGGTLRDALMSALAQAVRATDPWGPHLVTLDVEDHGRDDVIDPRSVGWWTQVFTVVDDGDSFRELPPAQRGVAAGERSDILFNHLGGMFTTGEDSSPVGFVPSPVPELPALDTVVGDDVPLRNPLSVTSVVTAEQSIQVTFIRGTRLVSEETARQLREEFLAALERQVGAQGGDARGVDTRAQTYTLPVTPTQEGMFYLEEQDDPGVAAYLTRMTFTLDGALDSERVLQAWSRLADRHPILRAYFTRNADGSVVATVDPALELDARYDEAFTEADMLRPFDVTAGPLTRLRMKQVDTAHADAPQRHIVDVVFHHIVADGWSAPLLIRDFFTLMDPDQDLVVVDPLPSLLAVRQSTSPLSAWRKPLRAAQPTMLAAGGRDQGTRTELRLTFDATTSEALTTTAQREHVTVAALIHGAWARVLSELTGQTRVTFGSVVSGRPLDAPGAQEAVGLYATTIPVAVTADSPVDAARSASQLLLLGAENPPSLADAQRLVEHGETSGADAPGDLFDSLMVVENYPLDQAALLAPLDGVAVSDLSFQDGTHYPVMMVAHSADRQVSLRIAVADGVELVGGATTDDLLAHLERHLRSIAGLPLLADQVKGLPMVSAAQRLSAADTDDIINTYAWALRDRGVGPGDTVAVALPRGVEQVCATLAVWLVGAATMPIEVNSTGIMTARAAAIVGRANPTVVVDSALLAELAATDSASRRFTPADRTRRLTRDDAAYIIHTSGTTGVPKGVVVPWQVMEDLIHWQTATGIIPSGATLAHYAPDQFDVSMQELLTAVAGRHALVVVAEEQRQDMSALARFLDSQGVDVLFATNVVLNALAREYARSGKPSVSVLVQAGEALQPGADLRAWCSSPDGPALYNQYGPTETHVVLATGNLSADSAALAAPSLGTPLPHVQALVLDEQLQPVPDGEPGELYIAGALADGYLDDPELTAERFPAGIGAVPRCHRTGDVVVKNPDGSFEYRGRADDQMKVRGVRIAPAEVVAIAQAVAGVAEAAACEVDGVLCLAVVAGADAPDAVIADDVREQYAQLVGGGDPAGNNALVPERVLVVPELPVTANGKTDIRMLHSWFRDGAPSGQEASTTATPGVAAGVVSVGASTSVDLVASIMADVLAEQNSEPTRVHPDDDFLALGGQSLSGTRLSGRLSSALGTPVSLRTILEHRTPRAIAEAVAAGDTDTGFTPEEFAEHYTQHTPTPGVPAPATPAQRRFWALAKVNPGDITYHLPLMVRLTPEGQGDADSLDARTMAGHVQRGVERLVRRHESLRTLLSGDVDGPQQVVLPADEAAHRLTITVLADEAELLRHRATPFRLDQDVPIRAAVCPDGDSVLLSLVIHHSACDGWSLPLLMADLEAAWTHAEEAADTTVVEPAPSPTGIIATWQDAWESSGQEARDREYWQEQLADVPCPLPLPLDRPRNPEGATKGMLASYALSDAEVQAVYEAARTLDATPFMVVHAAVAAVLSRLGCGEDIALATPVSGRHGGMDEAAVGCFVNLLVLRTSLAGNPDFRELVDRIRTTNLQAAEHGGMPFDVLVRELAAGGSKAHHPLATVGIGLQNLPSAFPAPAGVTATILPDNPEVSRFDMNVDVFLGSDDPSADLPAQLAIEFDSALFDEATVARIARRIKRVLLTAAATPDIKLHDLPVLLDDERAHLRTTHGTAAQPTESIRQLVRGVPTVGSVLATDGSWLSAEQLEQRVTAVARLLVAHGVKPGDVVSILCQRTVGQLVAQLAVLRTGAAYAPILPDTPAERLAAQFAQCGVRVALCSNTAGLEVPDSVTLVSIGDDAASTIGEAPEVDLPAAESIPADAPAYVLFTSGSTGTPKGVLVSRANLEALLAATNDSVPLTDTDVLLALSPFCFDVTGWEYLAPMAAGARLIIANDLQYRDPRAIVTLMAEHGVTCCEATPGLWSLIAEAAADELRGVRAVISGEDLPQTVATAVADAGAQVWNLYGPTEATVFATAGEQNAGPVDIGLPLPGVEIRVLDDYLVPVADGALGDLYLVGSQIAFGYVGRADLTAASFVADPQGTGRVMYRTGDQVRRHADGRLTYWGRRDQQIQLRGHRVEIGEVVSALLSLPEVAKAAAKVLERGTAKTLVGYVVLEDNSEGTAPDESTLLLALRRILPDYSVPAQLVFLPDMPLTDNGKVNVAALPDPEPEEWQEPETETEKLLAGIVAELLGSDELPGRNQGFISLGGDSITAIRLAARAAEQGLPITIQDVLVAPTIHELGAIADSRPRQSDTTAETAPEDHAMGDLSGLSGDDLSRVLGAFGDDSE